MFNPHPFNFDLDGDGVADSYAEKVDLDGDGVIDGLSRPPCWTATETAILKPPWWTRTATDRPTTPW